MTALRNPANAVAAAMAVVVRTVEQKDRADRMKGGAFHRAAARECLLRWHYWRQRATDPSYWDPDGAAEEARFEFRWCKENLRAMRLAMKLGGGCVMSNELWAVNILGPDDMLAAADLMQACEIANEFNAWWATKCAPDRMADDNWPLMWAVPTPWNGTPEGHAKDLADHNGRAVVVPE